MSQTLKVLFKIFFGIDISKDKFDACCIDHTGKTLFRVSLSMDRIGFEELIKRLSSLSVPKESILIGMESTLRVAPTSSA